MTRAARAALCGESFRFTPLRAFVGGPLAHLAHFSGRPAEAARIAQRAQTLTGLCDVAPVDGGQSEDGTLPVCAAVRRRPA